jgi:predicted glycosyltransferase
VPDRIPDHELIGNVLSAKKLVKYPGIKEELYIHEFQPDEGFRARLMQKFGVNNESVLAILRPPAITANYHDDKSSVLFDDVLHFLLNAKDNFAVIVPRTPEQAVDIRKSIAASSNVEGGYMILDQAVDGLQLAYAADMLISGGGTMNREGVLLGVPVYSIFAGRQGALDRAMEGKGLITFIRDARDLSKIRLERRDRSRPINTLTDRVEKSVIEHIDAFLS